MRQLQIADICMRPNSKRLSTPGLQARSECQAIQWGNSQLTQDVIFLIIRVVAAKKNCFLLWKPTHVDIFGIEKADNLAKEALNSLQLSKNLTLADAASIARCKFTSPPVKKLIIQ
ncbi:hypothetical protein TNCV_1668551 [Trichonephila clavipes]|nr:hypothetical protein TNCV_1668551 [Trichonephila clavipes]